MASVIRLPSHKMTSFNCPRCGALAAQNWFELLGSPSTGEGSTEVLTDAAIYDAWEGQSYIPKWTASHCFACGDNSIWLEDTLVYPDPRREAVTDATPHEDMPENAAELFREAVAVLPFSRRAAAALCRASMERLVKSLDPECPQYTKLDERLVRLEGRVSTATISLMNVLRHVGNTALHGEKDNDGSATIYVDEDDQTIAETFFLAINTLVDELITRPRRSEELYAALPEGVRKSYERKAGR